MKALMLLILSVVCGGWVQVNPFFGFIPGPMLVLYFLRSPWLWPYAAVVAGFSLMAVALIGLVVGTQRRSV